jgi:hypothetical protein
MSGPVEYFNMQAYLTIGRPLTLLVLFSISTGNLCSVAQPMTPPGGSAIYIAGAGTTPQGVSLNGEFRVFNTENRTVFLMSGFGYHTLRKEHR